MPTPLESSLSATQRDRLLEHVVARYNELTGKMAPFREEVAGFRQMMDGDFSARETRRDPLGGALGNIMAVRNDTLGMVDGFCDFSAAQALDDIVGDDEWLSVQPVGADDEELARQIRRHAPWKLEQCGVLPVLKDAIRSAPHLGTSFVKVGWEELVETWWSEENVLYVDGAPHLDPHGQLIVADLVEAAPAPAMEAGPADGPLLAIGKKAANLVLPGRRMVSPKGMPDIVLDAASAEQRTSLTEHTALVRSGLVWQNIHHGDITYDLTAPALDLCHTPVFHRFKIGILDARRIYGLSDEQIQSLLATAGTGSIGADSPVSHRTEQAPDNSALEIGENPNIVLVEGYLRLDPAETGSPVRLYCVFQPESAVMVRADYLQNVTPNGELPIFPLRWFRTEGRIAGRGYWKTAGDANDSIDRLHNLTLWRDGFAAQPICGYDPDALANPDEIEGEMDMSKPFRLASGKTISDLFQFAAVPDLSSRSIELMNQKLQMQQLRYGITSAAQGELKSLPQTNTATGVNQIASRGAVILKWPITDLREDATRLLAYSIKVMYRNQNTDETFAWGDGRARELISLRADAVRDLDFDVTFSVSQSQDIELRENTAAAIQTAMAYLAIPEPEKPAVRDLYVQSVNLLGFRNAEQIIREPLAPEQIPVDPATGQPSTPAMTPTA